MTAADEHATQGEATRSRQQAGAERALMLLARTYLTLMVPVLLVLVSARLVMTQGYLWLEYNRPGFPPDRFGFTLEDRLYYAPLALNYLFNAEGVRYLGDLKFPDGQPLFTGRELRHMVDVKVVTQYAFGLALAGGLVAAVIAYWLAQRSDRRAALRRALRDGAVITLALIASIVILAFAAWDVFFTGFHNLFFAEGSWLFLYSDTLIRLFPEQFWFDAALVIGGLTTLGALGLLALAQWGGWRGQDGFNGPTV